MSSSLEKSLTKEGWLPETQPVKPAFNRRVLTSAAAAAAAKRRAQEAAEAEDELRVAARAARQVEQTARLEAEAKIGPVTLLKWMVLIALGIVVIVPAIVYVGRSLQTNDVLTKEGQSGAVMTCTRGVTEAADDSTAWTWLVGGSRFRCTDWETAEGRKWRDREQAEEQYLVRERAKRKAANYESADSE